MVSKLQLAVQEVTQSAIDNKEAPEIIGKLFDHYFEINEGIGVKKSPKLYGGFPTDPYSHTPFTKGVQQPGMTGQVKEDILSRFGELGVSVKEGILEFNPSMLRKEELLQEQTVFTYVNVLGDFKTLELDKKSLCFTYCQVPIVYKSSNRESIEVCFTNATSKKFNLLKLDTETSKLIFERSNSVQSLTVSIIK